MIDQLAETLASNFNAVENSSRDKSFFDDESNIEPILSILVQLMRHNPDIEITETLIKKIRTQGINKAKAKVERGGGENHHIDGHEIETWLDENKQSEIGWGSEIKTYRERYFKYLEVYRSRSRESIIKTRESTLRCLQKIGNPKGNYNFNSRGLVVGPVQGGKTEHFNGVIASAFDAGYHLIIVLSGIMEDLRQQTQERIINDVVGTRVGSGEPTGAELVEQFGANNSLNNNAIRVLTSLENDFNANVAGVESILNSSKTLLVCKKNGGILKQILVYLEKQVGEANDTIPILIIDDEADNATLNNNSHRKDTLASLINKRVRAILNIFKKNAYVGYTASPFANILQHREEEEDRKIEPDSFSHRGKDYKFEIGQSLFPRNFIELITPPPNYIGLKQLFETKEDLIKVEPIFVPIDDELHSFPKFINKETGDPEERKIRNITRSTNKYDSFPHELPESLKDAIYCFILAVAIRKTRSKELRDTPYYQPHNTMLIHVSRWITWQNYTKDLIDDELEKIAAKVSDENPNQLEGIYPTFEKHFNTYFASNLTVGINEYLPENYNDEFMSIVKFEDIKPLLASTLDEIETVALNSETGDNLSYKKESPKTYLAIGGNRLSRGFTLEGLSVCYFIRDANFADTLLQMARWFGYRIGYLDCCKLFITEDAIEKFNSISLTVEDLEDTIIDLSKQPKSVTPDKYGLKVATNIDVIKLTRPTMLKNTRRRRVSFDDRLEQTYKFALIQDDIEKAYESVSNVIRRESSNFNPEAGGMLTYRNASSSLVIELLECERSFCDSNANGLIKYIEDCNKSGYLSDWCVAIKTTGDGSKINGVDFGFNENAISSVVRRIPNEDRSRKIALDALSANPPIFKVGRSSITQPQDLKVAVDDKMLIDETVKKWKKENKTVDGKPKAVPENVYRHLMTPQQGVFILYLIDSHEVFKGTDGTTLKELEHQYSIFKTQKPLIGFVIGTPKIMDSPISDYVEDENIDDYLDTSFSDEDEDLDKASILGES